MKCTVVLLLYIKTYVSRVQYNLWKNVVRISIGTHSFKFSLIWIFNSFKHVSLKNILSVKREDEEFYTIKFFLKNQTTSLNHKWLCNSFAEHIQWFGYCNCLNIEYTCTPPLYMKVCVILRPSVLKLTNHPRPGCFLQKPRRCVCIDIFGCFSS